MSFSPTFARLVLFLIMQGFFEVITLTNARRLASKKSLDVGCEQAGGFYLTTDCKMKCYCRKDGEVSCVDLCHWSPPAEMEELCEAGTKLVKEKELVGTAGKRKCYCLNRYCQRVSCRVKDREYKIGETFVQNNCSERCRCGKDGHITCHPLCPKMTCPRGKRARNLDHILIAQDDGCFCSVQECVPVSCRVKDREYKIGETFVQNNCSERCRCGKYGHITCQPLCPKMTCPRGKRARNVDHTMIAQDERCFCSRQACTPPVRPKCKIANDSFPHGKVFITSDCQTKCRCKKNNTKRCEPLCSTSSPVCSQDEEVISTVKFYAQKRCSCTKKRCAKKGSSTNSGT